MSSDGRFAFAGARTGHRGVRAWNLDHFHELRDTRGFASAARVASHAHGDARLRGFCAVAARPGDGATARYRLLCGVGYGSLSVWDAGLPSRGGRGGDATWACVFHEAAGGPALLGGALCAGGDRALTRVRGTARITPGAFASWRAAGTGAFRTVPWIFHGGSRRRPGRHVDIPWSHADAAAGTWIFHESRRRRGWDVDIPWSHGDAAAGA